MSDFGAKFATLLKSRNMSQLQASKEFGVSHPAIAGWLKGAIPRQSKLESISRFFEIELKVLTDNTRDLPKVYLSNEDVKNVLDGGVEGDASRMTNEELEAEIEFETKNVLNLTRTKRRWWHLLCLSAYAAELSKRLKSKGE